LFPPSSQDWLPPNHLVYFLLEVSEQMDLSPILRRLRQRKGGQPPLHPRMMLVLLLYAYCVGVFSSRKIMARCETDVAFRVIVGDEHSRLPPHRGVPASSLAAHAGVVSGSVGVVPPGGFAQGWPAWRSTARR
jgi:hypothetical protein